MTTPWHDFLRSLEQPIGRFAPAHIETIEKLWDRLRMAFPTLPFPVTGPTADGVTIQMSWDLGRRNAAGRPIHHIDVDVLANGMYEWFYRNRHSGALDGSEDPIYDLPPLFFTAMELCMRSHTKETPSE